MSALLRRIPRSIQIGLLTLCTITILFELRHVVQTQKEWVNPISDFGSRDLLAFWAGTRVFLSGENLYTGANVLALQKQIMPSMTEPQVFLNPPWALLPFSLFFSLSFETTRLLWIALNLCCLYVLASIVRKLFSKQFRTHTPGIALSAVLYFPTVYNFWMGQLTLVVCTALFFSLYSLFRQRYLGAALPGAIVLWKPHLLLPLLVVVALLAQRKKMVRLLLFASATCLICLLYPLFWKMNIYASWQAMDFSPLAYRTATVVALVREIIEFLTGDPSRWPAFVIPLLTSLFAAVWFLNRREPSYTVTHLFALLTASLTFAPYAWPYDFVMLLPIQMAAFTALTKDSLGATVRVKGLGALFLPQLLFFIQSCFTDSLGAGCWFPAALFCSWLYIKKSCSIDDRFVVGG